MSPIHPAEAREHVRVLVVGAGQAGLSVTYFLQKSGMRPGADLLVVDRGPDTGGAWQFRWEALRLGSAHRVADLPGMSAMGMHFDDADRTRPARDVVAEYYRRYESATGMSVRRPAEVVRVEDSGGGLVATIRTPAGDTGVAADVVVNATGTWGTPFVPWVPGRDTFSGVQIDTTGYRSAEDFAGADVIVVGGGTSAIGFLLELQGVAASTLWCTRRPVSWVQSGELDIENATAAVAQQDAAARAGRTLPSIVSGTGVPISRRIRAGIDHGVLIEHPMFTAVEPDGVRFANGTGRHADAIIWATGFRPELRHLAPLGLREAGGGPIVVDGVAAKDPRVFFAGYGPQASTIGANRAGRTTARHVLEQLAAQRACGVGRRAQGAGSVTS